LRYRSRLVAWLRRYCELIDGNDEPRNKYASRAEGVVADVLMDRIEVIARLRRPMNARHSP
jgi:hypothetical protein